MERVTAARTRALLSLSLSSLPVPPARLARQKKIYTCFAVSVSLDGGCGGCTRSNDRRERSSPSPPVRLTAAGRQDRKIFILPRESSSSSSSSGRWYERSTRRSRRLFASYAPVIRDVASRRRFALVFLDFPFPRSVHSGSRPAYQDNRGGINGRFSRAVSLHREFDCVIRALKMSLFAYWKDQ